MMHSTTLKKELEKWWKHLDKPFSIMEKSNDLAIGSVVFSPLGDSNWYDIQTKRTIINIRGFQCIEPVENTKGEIVYPTLVIYIEICNGIDELLIKKLGVTVSVGKETMICGF